MKDLDVWTVDSLKCFMMTNMNNPHFYPGGKGQTSVNNVGKYWDYIHQNSHKIPNIESYYIIM